MSANWVAGAVRARALADRRVGTERARQIATSATVGDAVDALADTPYGRGVHPGQSLAEAQRAVAATLLWHLRVMSGWLPPDGVNVVRLLAAWFEIANVDELLQRQAGGATEPAFDLGALATAWPRLAEGGTPAEVRAALAASSWGDPGSDLARDARLAMRLRWAGRLARTGLAAAPWGAGAAALLVAGERYAARRELPGAAGDLALAALGRDAMAATSLPDLEHRLPGPARWALEDVEDAGGLWRAETRWWARVRQDGFTLLRGWRFGPEPVLGAVAVLAADAWQVRAALECAAHEGRVEEFDALA